jgi:hypothetical protein
MNKDKATTENNMPQRTLYNRGGIFTPLLSDLVGRLLSIRFVTD